MAMTKADFAAMAGSIKEAKRDAEFELSGDEMIFALVGLEHAAKRLATACAGQYKGGYGFNRSRFMDACGFGDANGN